MTDNAQKVIDFMRSNPIGKKSFTHSDLQSLNLTDKVLESALEELENSNLIEYHTEWIVPTIKLL